MEETCFLCLRITPKMIMKNAYKIWENHRVARKVAEKTSEIISECYEQDPTLFCGKSGKAFAVDFFILLHTIWVRGYDVHN